MSKILAGQNLNNFSMKGGFTLIELIIYIALAALILNLGVYSLWQIMEAKAKSLACQEVQQNLRFILEKISFEARQAKSVEIPEKQGEESKELLLKMTDGSTIRFYLEKEKLILDRRNPVGVSVFPLTSEKVRITELIFKNLSPSLTRPETFQIKMKVSRVNPLKRIEYQAEISTQKTINLRDNPTPNLIGIIP